MKTILLYGALGKKFGKEHFFEVDTIKEAISALNSVVKGFKEHMLHEGAAINHVIYQGYEDRSITGYNDKLTKDDPIRLIPLVDGSGGFFKAVLGIALIVFATPLAGAILGAGTAAAATLATSFVGMGVSMILGGVSEMLFGGGGDTGQSSYESPDNKPSYSFDGAINTIRQGNPVPIGYGRLRVGSQVISAGLSAENID